MATTGRRRRSSPAGGSGRPAASDALDDTSIDDARDESGSEAKPSRNADFVQSLERGLAVIRAFGPGRTQLTLSDVARETNLTRAAARRFLLTLLDLGYIDFDGRLFSLRPQVLELGYSYISTLSFSDIALPAMRDLVEQTAVSVSMAVLDGDDAVYVAHVSAKRILAITVSVGTRVPAHAAALGQVLLAALPDEQLRRYLDQERARLTPETVVEKNRLAALLDDVRAQGYAIGDEGLELGLRAVAVPVADARGTVVASLGVSTQATPTTPELLRDEYLPKLRTTAAQISGHLRSAAAPVAP